MKYLKLFNVISEYNTFKNSNDYVLPNVSYIVEDNSVCFENETKKEQWFPNNTIIYTSMWQLTESSDVTDSKTGMYGLYTKGFGGNDGKELTIINHTFTKNDGESYGIGVIEFDDDVASINHRAFNQTAVVTLELPSTIKNYVNHAIYKCTELTSITCYATTNLTINIDAFLGSDNITQLYYPKGSDYSAMLHILGDNCKGIEF